MNITIQFILNRSGRITASELRQALKNGNNSYFSQEICNTLITLFDVDKTTTIDFNEFQQLFGFINQWKSAFEMYDKDNSCSIDEKELEQTFIQMGYRFSSQMIETIMKKFDSPSKKGQISFENFILACVKIHKLTRNISCIKYNVKTLESKSFVFCFQMFSVHMTKN